MEDVLWYYSDNTLTQQLGPFTAYQMQEMLGKGAIDGKTIAWHDEVAAWLPLSQIFKGKIRFIPETLGMTLAQGTYTARRKSCPGLIERLGTRLHEMGHTSAAYNRMSCVSKPYYRAEDWTLEASIEGQQYYINKKTGEVTWELPLYNSSGLEEYLWVPDALDGYSPTTVIERLKDHSLVVKKFTDAVPYRVSARLAKRCLPLYKPELTRPLNVRLT